MYEVKIKLKLSKKEKKQLVSKLHDRICKNGVNITVGYDEKLSFSFFKDTDNYNDILDIVNEHFVILCLRSFIDEHIDINDKDKIDEIVIKKCDNKEMYERKMSLYSHVNNSISVKLKYGVIEITNSVHLAIPRTYDFDDSSK